MAPLRQRESKHGVSPRVQTRVFGDPQLIHATGDRCWEGEEERQGGRDAECLLFPKIVYGQKELRCDRLEQKISLRCVVSPTKKTVFGHSLVGLTEACGKRT